MCVHVCVCTGYLETTHFVRSSFESEMLSSPAFEESAECGLQAFLSPACRQLYQDITARRKWSADRKGWGSHINFISLKP